jgi:hypothetical protein
LSQQQPDRISFVKFEDMKFDMDKEVRKLVKFLELKLDEQQLAKVFNHCSFESMKVNLNGI